MRIQRRFHRILPKSRPGMIHRPTRPAALGTAVIPPVRAAVSRTVKMTTAQAGARGTDPAADRETAVTPVLAEVEARAMTIMTMTAAGIAAEGPGMALETVGIPVEVEGAARAMTMMTATGAAEIKAGTRGMALEADRETAVTLVLAEGEARAMTITTTTAGVRGTGLAAGQGTVGIPVLAEVEARAMTIMTTTAIAVEAETVEAAVAVQGVVEAAADDHQLCLTHNAG